MKQTETSWAGQLATVAEPMENAVRNKNSRPSLECFPNLHDLLELGRSKQHGSAECCSNLHGWKTTQTDRRQKKRKEIC